ncbi:hybrid sensor histidine kinase/response regulator [Candidatus Dependentiae bacterium]|nr:hybrid sensor histidine kinase/response regulator [Candidatus Dependentiae bacterium]
MGYSPEIKNIIIIDDEEIICKSLERLLGINNYNTMSFLSAEDAITFLETNQRDTPELIITDYNLKKQNGIELLEKLKKNYPEISVIIITGYGYKELVIESLRFGADDFIDKPFNSENIIDSIKKINNKRISNYKIHKQKSSSIMHEINNHLSIMKNSAHLLKIDKNSYSEISDILNNQIDLMNETIKTILSPENFVASSIKIIKGNFNISTLIKTVILLLENNAADKNIKIETELIDTNISGDINYVRQVIMNILLNAIIYSPPHTSIKINMKNEKQHIIIEIADEGIGIQDKFKEKIFDYGFRINQEIKGCGIGLFFAKNVLNAHDGRIEVIDNRPRGSIFRIILNLIENR